MGKIKIYLELKNPKIHSRPTQICPYPRFEPGLAAKASTSNNQVSGVGYHRSVHLAIKNICTNENHKIFYPLNI